MLVCIIAHITRRCFWLYIKKINDRYKYRTSRKANPVMLNLFTVFGLFPAWFFTSIVASMLPISTMVVFACGLLVQSFFLTEDRHWAGDWRWRHPVTCSKSAFILSRAPSLPCYLLLVSGLYTCFFAVDVKSEDRDGWVIDLDTCLYSA